MSQSEEADGEELTRNDEMEKMMEKNCGVRLKVTVRHRRDKQPVVGDDGDMFSSTLQAVCD